MPNRVQQVKIWPLGCQVPQVTVKLTNNLVDDAESFGKGGVEDLGAGDLLADVAQGLVLSSARLHHDLDVVRVEAEREAAEAKGQAEEAAGTRHCC